MGNFYKYYLLRAIRLNACKPYIMNTFPLDIAAFINSKYIDYGKYPIVLIILKVSKSSVTFVK